MTLSLSAIQKNHQATSLVCEGTAGLPAWPVKHSVLHDGTLGKQKRGLGMRVLVRERGLLLGMA